MGKSGHSHAGIAERPHPEPGGFVERDANVCLFHHLRHSRRRHGFFKGGPGQSIGKGVSTAKTRPFPHIWIAGLATDHVPVTRRESTLVGVIAI